MLITHNRPRPGAMSSEIPPALVSISIVDKRGRITFDSQIREEAGIKEGDRLKVALLRNPKKDWMMTVSKIE